MKHYKFFSFFVLLTLIFSVSVIIVGQDTQKYYQANLYRSSDYRSSDFGFSSTTDRQKSTKTQKKSTTTTQPNVSGMTQGRVPTTRTKGKTQFVSSKARGTVQAQPFPARVDVAPNKAVLYISPLNSKYEVEDVFISEVKFFNPINSMVDYIKLHISYDPAILRVDYVDDTNLRNIVNINADNKVDHSIGDIIYMAELPQPSTVNDMMLLEIGWTVLRKSSSTPISFVFEGDNPTQITYNGIDVLGDGKIEDDGVIDAVVEAYDPNDSEVSEEFFISPITLRDKVVKSENVHLSLASKKSSYDVDDVFVVNVVLKTKEPIFIQSFELCIKFDPEKLKVLDWDKGNFITRDVNICDGAFHKKFPFDFLIKNDVDNSTGIIEYKMGLTSDVEINSGTVASIKFKALEKVKTTAIKFFFGQESNQPSTKITYLGKDYLDEANKDNLKNISISIK